VLIGAFTTDWQQHPAPDEEKSRITGKREFIEGKVAMSFGGTFYYRGAMPLTELAKQDDWDVKLSWRFQTQPDGSITMMDTMGEWFTPDIIWMQRWMHKEGYDQLMRARATGQIVVNDLDDGFWHLPKSNIAHQTTDPKNNPDFNRDHYLHALSASNLLTVSTEALAKDMERLLKGKVPIEVCKNAIDLELWKIHDPSVDGFVGWVGGIQWRANDIHVLRPALNEFLVRYNLPIYHGGDSNVAGVPKFWEQAGIDPKVTHCVAAPLCHIAQYPGLWQPINLALVPLENHPFNVRKSHLKGLEASACGIPFIYSSKMPEYEAFGAGIMADNAKPATWMAALESMLDPDARLVEGARNRAIAEQWDIKARWTQWDKAIRSVIPNLATA
jgi:hypothetical protein